METLEIFIITLWVFFVLIIIGAFIMNTSKRIKGQEKLNLFPFKNFNKSNYAIFSVAVIILLSFIIILSSLEYSDSSNKFFS
jgi:hypothetical protein